MFDDEVIVGEIFIESINYVVMVFLGERVFLIGDVIFCFCIVNNV